MDKIRSASQLRQKEAAKETRRKFNKDRKRITELDTIIKKLYGSFAIGRISEERFDSLLAGYEEEQKSLIVSTAEAQGLTRASKHPKSTKFGRQNLIAERWNSEEQLVAWRKAWADVTNRHLERHGHEERIDHRSHAGRGLDQQPTIHEGVIARALEKKGIPSDRCEINRQIKADNALLRELKAAVRKLTQAVQNTISPAVLRS